MAAGSKTLVDLPGGSSYYIHGAPFDAPYFEMTSGFVMLQLDQLAHLAAREEMLQTSADVRHPLSALKLRWCFSAVPVAGPGMAGRGG